jgi:hypothetical protein
MSPRRATATAKEEPRRGHPAMKFNQELADQFGIIPGADPPREVVKVAALPDPPPAIVPGGPAPSREQPLNIDEIAVNILKEEAQELAVRLNRYGVAFNAMMQQEMVDHGMALLSGLVGGGARARR